MIASINQKSVPELEILNPKKLSRCFPAHFLCQIFTLLDTLPICKVISTQIWIDGTCVKAKITLISLWKHKISSFNKLRVSYCRN